MDVERADGRADLADQEIRGPERGVVALAPEHTDSAFELGEVAEQRAAAAHLAAVEARATDAVGLDVDRLLGDAGRVAEHVHEQVVAADLAEEPLVVPGLLVAPDRPVGEPTGGKATGRDQAEMGHPRPDPPGETRGDRAAER